MTTFLIPKFSPADQARRLQSREVIDLIGKLTPKQRLVCDRKSRRGTLRWVVAATSFVSGRGRAIGVIRDAYVAGKIDVDEATVLFSELFGRPVRDVESLLAPRPRRKAKAAKRSVVLNTVVTPKPVAEPVLRFSADRYDATIPEAVAERLGPNLVSVWDAILRRAEFEAEANEVAWDEAGWGSEIDYHGTWSDDVEDDREWIAAGFSIRNTPDCWLPTTLPAF